MHSLNTKIFLAALGVAILATPALAQTRHRQARDYGAVQNVPVEHYSAANRDSGAVFNLGY